MTIEGILSETVEGATLIGRSANSFVGKARVIQQGPDDGTGASGNSGQTIACAAIEAD